MSAAETLTAFELFKRTLEAARDCHKPDMDESNRHLRGLLDGLQIAINGIDAEIALLRIAAQGKTDIAQIGIEAALTFDQDHHKSQ